MHLPSSNSSSSLSRPSPTRASIPKSGGLGKYPDSGTKSGYFPNPPNPRPIVIFFANITTWGKKSEDFLLNAQDDDVQCIVEHHIGQQDLESFKHKVQSSLDVAPQARVLERQFLVSKACA